MSNHRKNGERLMDNLYPAVIWGIALFAFVVYLAHAGGRTIWGDELSQMAYTNKSLGIEEMWKRYVRIDVQPPLYPVIIALWQKIAPFGTKWLALPSEMASATAIAVCGFAAARIRNQRTGIICSSIAAFSIMLIAQSVYTMRPYAFLFLFSALSVYTYVRRGRDCEGKSIKWVILFGVALTLMIYTHFFGVLVMAALFLCDFFFYLKKRIPFRYVLSYILAGLVFLPFIVLFANSVLPGWNSFWPTVPTPKSFLSLYNFLLEGSYLLQVGFIIAVISFAATLVFTKIQNGKKMEERLLSESQVEDICILLFTALFVSVVIYIYSAHINPAFSLWVLRYFIAVIPGIFITCAIGVDIAYEFVAAGRKSAYISSVYVAICCFVLFSATQGAYSVQPSNGPYEPAAHYLREQPDIRDERVAFLTTGGNDYFFDSMQYYFTENYTKERVPKLSTGIILSEQWDDENWSSIEKVYLFDPMVSISDPSLSEIKDILDTDYTLQQELKALSLRVYTRNSES